MVDKQFKDLYVFPITIPNNPLKWLNCYVIKPSDGSRCLLIDTGFNQPECKRDLLNGIAELELIPENTDVFLTHLHSDHTGNAALLKSMGFNILMGDTDLFRINNLDKSYFPDAALQLGFPSQEFGRMIRSQLASSNTYFLIEATGLANGQVLSYGEFELQAIVTPGHTPGHICLYDKNNKVLFSGDHVLYDISPNITSFHDGTDALGHYLHSLETINSLDVEYIYPGHRSYGNLPFHDRVYELLSHHDYRLEETLNIVKKHDGISAVDAASEMHWNIRTRSWSDMPSGQKWFAAGEAMAHLDHLSAINEISSELIDGIVIYK